MQPLRTSSALVVLVVAVATIGCSEEFECSLTCSSPTGFTLQVPLSELVQADNREQALKICTDQDVVGCPFTASFFVGCLCFERSGNPMSRIGDPQEPLRLLADGLRTGNQAPIVRVRSLDGTPTTIDYRATDRATVLYFFSPSCVWSDSNLENIRAVAARRRDNYRFVAISTADGDLNAAARALGQEFEVYKADRDALGFRVEGTPQTVVISPRGVIENRWMGAYGAGLRSQVEAYFSLVLPGLSPFEVRGD